MKILGVNISHNPSICIIEDSVVKEFYNEERFVLLKNFDLYEDKFEILQSILQKIKFKPDIVCYASFGRFLELDFDADTKIINKIQKQLNNPNYFFNFKEHHLYHAITGFYFSDYKEAAAIVIDGGGACNYLIPYQEMESIYLINNKNCYPIYKHSSNARSLLNITNSYVYKYVNGYINKFSSEVVGGMAFQKACNECSLDGEKDAGKLMGLSSYGYTDKKYNLDYNKVKIAKDVQEKTFQDTCALIDKAKQHSSNIILSGGYALNCSNNFKYVKKYPELNFFVDPVPNDPGTAIGVGLYYENYK